MSINRVSILTLLLGSLLMVNSCKNDLEINAPYDAKPIVYALLNPYDSIQYIKVVKSFLGEENPETYAGIADSSQFNTVEGYVDEYLDGVKINTYPLQATQLNNKKPGIFASPNQTLYTFKTNLVSGTATYLNTNSEFEIRAKLNGTIDINSRTKMIVDAPSFFYQQSVRQQLWKKPGNTKSQGTIKFASSSQMLEGLKLEAELPVNCKMAKMKMIFYYKEILTGPNGCTEELKSIEYDMGTITVTDPNKLNKENFAITSERFFEKISNGMLDAGDVPNFYRRVADRCDFEIIMGDDDFYSYIQVTKPSDDLNQNKPQFSNIENGFGIFGCRIITRLSQQTLRVNYEDLSGLLDSHTQNELITGALGGGTGAKGFCMDPEIAAGSSYGSLKCEQCK